MVPPYRRRRPCGSTAATAPSSSRYHRHIQTITHTHTHARVTTVNRSGVLERHSASSRMPGLVTFYVFLLSTDDDDFVDDDDDEDGHYLLRIGECCVLIGASFMCARTSCQSLKHIEHTATRMTPEKRIKRDETTADCDSFLFSAGRSNHCQQFEIRF